ncbi:MAG: ATP-binding protein [Desulforhopalus sp.]|jgi:signal transduction histidine kinase|nr:ATP-binding protein [Desulforhopalus sp.]
MVWIFALYLLYGLAFFTLGVAILSRDIHLSELGIAKILWLLAGFGIVHGFHEWLELLELLFPTVIDTRFTLFRLIVVSLSFLFLFYFGLFLNIITLRGDQGLQTIRLPAKALVAGLALFLILFAAWFDFGSGNDIRTRMLVALPGGMLSGVGLILYSRTVRPLSDKAATQFILAGGWMVAYAILAGLMPSDALFPVLGVKVIVLRGLSAFFMMIFTIRALSVFNIEQQRLVAEQLQRFSQSEKLASMGILAAGIAHEINTPLTNISLNVEMLRDLVECDPRSIKKIAAIERNIDRASRIARELLHFSREKETALIPTDLNRVAASAVNLIKTQAHSTAIELRLQAVPMILGIPWKLEEVVINLLLNSLDACAGQGTIIVETQHMNQQVVMHIRDSGCGIKPEDLSKVFDPFFTTKEIGKGTGLGLSVCYSIVQQHGGNITLANRQTGGTRVTLLFPEATDDNRNNSGR